MHHLWEGSAIPDRNELRQIIWMRQQWRRFRQLLWGALGGVWLVCCAGILLASEDEFLIRWALIFMLVLATGYAVCLWFVTRREIRALDRRSLELRADLARASIADD